MESSVKLNWFEDDYFILFREEHDKAIYALQFLLDDLRASKVLTANKLLYHADVKNIFDGLFRLLMSSLPRIRGGAAYTLGILADVSWSPVFEFIKRKSKNGFDLVQTLTDILNSDDAEVVSNVAGTLGTIAENQSGWQLFENYSDLDTMLIKLADLLDSPDATCASNSALVFARLAVPESLCQRLIDHPQASHIASHLVNSLISDEAGCGLNSAFALARIFETKNGLKVVLSLREKNSIPDKLCVMLRSEDISVVKNTCYCLSCLARSKEGHRLVMECPTVKEMIGLLARGLSREDMETAWFTAMTLHTICTQVKGAVLIRKHTDALMALKQCLHSSNASDDVKDEVTSTLDILSPLDKPTLPSVELTSSTEALVTWSSIQHKTGFQVKYQLYCNDQRIYDGRNTSHTLAGLLPCTVYKFKVKNSTEVEESSFSEEVAVSTPESIPSEPANVRLLVATTSQVKIAWDPPTSPNGLVRCYCVFNGEKLVETTQDLTAIISGLQPNTPHDVSIAACTSKGRGPKATVIANTLELGAHAPRKPSLNLIGRSEIHVTWEPPDNPLGRMTRYEVLLNSNRVIYAGTETQCRERGLAPDTEYRFTVVVITNVGKFESKPAKKKTGKNEYGCNPRAPLYDPGRRGSTGSFGPVSGGGTVGPGNAPRRNSTHPKTVKGDTTGTQGKARKKSLEKASED